MPAAVELCLANLTLPDAGPAALVTAAAAGGFDSVNVWLAPPPAVHVFGAARGSAATLVGDVRAAADVRARCGALGVRVFEGSAGWIDQSFRRDAIAPALETLAALDARAIVLVGWDDDRARLLAHLAAICEAAAAYRLRVHLEFMPYSAVPTLRDAAGVLAEVAQPNLALIVDALHLARSGGMPHDLVVVDPALIASVQLCDAPAQPPGVPLRIESVTARRDPGDGELPLHALLDRVRSDAVIEAEVPVADEAALPLEERARRRGDALRRFLAQRRQGFASGVVIRPLREADWEGLRALRLRALLSEPGVFFSRYEDERDKGESDWRALASNGTDRQQVFGLFEGDALIGVTGVFTDRGDSSGTTAAFGMSYIVPSHRKRGFARLLYEARLAWTRTHGRFVRIRVSHRRSNEASRKAISRNGFARVDVVRKTWPDGAVEDEIVYELPIPPMSP